MTFSRLSCCQSGHVCHFPLGKWQIWGSVLVSAFLFLNFFSGGGSGCVQSHFRVFFWMLLIVLWILLLFATFGLLLPILSCWLLSISKVLLSTAGFLARFSSSGCFLSSCYMFVSLLGIFRIFWLAFLLCFCCSVSLFFVGGWFLLVILCEVFIFLLLLWLLLLLLLFIFSLLFLAWVLWVLFASVPVFSLFFFWSMFLLKSPKLGALHSEAVMHICFFFFVRGHLDMTPSKILQN